MKTIKIRILILLSIGSCLTFTCKESKNTEGISPNEDKPNIIFILADDQGWGDIGVNDSAFYTPNLDRLADEGVWLNQNYVQPMCTPTRVGLLTGRYPSRFGPQATSPTNLQAIPFGTPTLASVLRKQGYYTALIGKWHLGSVEGQAPNYWDFDYSYGCLAGAVGAYDHRYKLQHKEYAVTWHRNGMLIPGSETGKPYQEGYHVTDLLVSDAVKLIEKERENPFFLYLPFTVMHTPLVEEEKWFNDPLGKIASIEHEGRRVVAAAMHHLDYGVGRVINSLKKTGKYENTLIIYSSDNGGIVSRTYNGAGYPEPDPILEVGFSSNGKLRGQKSDVYEGGIRVPGIVSWPDGGLNKKTVVNKPIHITDWLPTIVKLTGAEMPLELDGVDVLPLLQGKKGIQRIFYYAFSRPVEGGWLKEALRKDDWKIVKPGNESQWELYNLANDPYEENNLAAYNSVKLNELLQLRQKEMESDTRFILPSAWIKGPKAFNAEKRLIYRVHFSCELKKMDDSVFEVSGAEIKQFRRSDGKNNYQLVLAPSGSQDISIQVKKGATNSKRGNIAIEPSAIFLTAYDPKLVQ